MTVDEQFLEKAARCSCRRWKRFDSVSLSGKRTDLLRSFYVKTQEGGRWVDIFDL